MEQLREHVDVSFKDLEWGLWAKMRDEFAVVFASLLEDIDAMVLKSRDGQRFVPRDIQERTVDTLLGTSVTFRRRRYRDNQTGKSVYLLDVLLGLRKYSQISPGLRAAMLTQAVTTSSYRKAAESLSDLLGFAVTSHESIRQCVIEVGAGLENERTEQLQDPQGTRPVDVLFVEADGMHVSLQQEDKRSIEEKLVTFHEGWEPRHPSSKEFRLVGVEQFRTNESDCWELASRYAYSHWNITDDTIVIINGDRDKWIRAGVEKFPNAMYQIDRFHLIRDLRYLFRPDTKTLKDLLDALNGDDVTGATFVAKLAEATSKLKDEQRHKRASNLLKDVSSIPEATVDYRKRLKALGRSVDGFRGLGSAESQVDRLSDRMKGRGQSWRPEGEGAMMELLCARNTGRFRSIVERLETWFDKKPTSVVSLRNAAERAARATRVALKPALKIPVGGTPVDAMGTQASGGLSAFIHRLNESGMPA